MPENTVPASQKGAKQKVQQKEVNSGKRRCKNGENRCKQKVKNNEKSGKVKKMKKSGKSDKEWKKVTKSGKITEKE